MSAQWGGTKLKLSAGEHLIVKKKTIVKKETKKKKRGEERDEKTIGFEGRTDARFTREMKGCVRTTKEKQRLMGVGQTSKKEEGAH